MYVFLFVFQEFFEFLGRDDGSFHLVRKFCAAMTGATQYLHLVRKSCGDGSNLIFHLPS